MAGVWPDWDGKTQDDLDFASLADLHGRFSAVDMTVAAAREALVDAGFNAGVVGGTDFSFSAGCNASFKAAMGTRRVALVLGSCFGQGFSAFHEVTEWVAKALGLDAFAITVSTACASSTNAIGLGRDLLLQGQADVVLAGGVDIFLKEILAGFQALGVVSRDKCAPFGTPFGINLGEGAGMVVLERVGSRTHAVRAVIEGYALSADAFHETTPDPSGRGIERAVRWALADAQVSPSSIDYVNAHATGTESNDRVEWMALARVLDGVSRERPLPVLGLKSFLGHAQGAAGVLELILAVLAQEDETLPPTLRCTAPRPGAPPDPVACERPRPAARGRALKISAAFGGANAVLVYAPPGLDPAVVSSADRGTDLAPDEDVFICGIGAVSPLGVGFAAVSEAFDQGRLLEGRVPRFDFGIVLPTVDPRGMDAPAIHLTTATALALGQGPVGPVGLFLGATRMAQQSSRRCRASLEAHGPTGLSAAAFARMSVNAPAGACSKALALRGPTSTLSVGAGSGLAAFAYAAAWLSTRRDAPSLVAAAHDEERACETAVAVHLCRAPRGTVGIVVAGWGWARPGDVTTAARGALTAARASLSETPTPDGIFADGEAARCALAPEIADAATLPLGFHEMSKFMAPGEACRSLVAVALAVRALEAGRARSLLVIAAEGQSATIAVLLQRRER